MVKKSKPSVAKPKRSGPRAQTKAMVRKVADSYESKLLHMIVDPCGADLVPGLGLSANGICQRFTKYLSWGATTENNISMFFNPNSQSASGGITVRGAVGAAAPTYVISDSNPGEQFLEANSETSSVLGYCVEVAYIGKLTDRKGYVGVCQAPMASLNDIATSASINPNTLIPYCQATQPVLSEAVSVKYIPALNSFTANSQVTETGNNALGNGILIVLSGVDLANFIVKVTACYEYVPKASTTYGLAAPRPTKSVAPGTAERVVTTLDKMGHWWHNLGDAAAAANRLGGRMLYGAGQVAKFAGNVARIARPATTLLALAG